jgi:hypothetical protein
MALDNGGKGSDESWILNRIGSGMDVLGFLGMFFGGLRLY